MLIVEVRGGEGALYSIWYTEEKADQTWIQPFWYLLLSSNEDEWQSEFSIICGYQFERSGRINSFKSI